MSNKGLVRLTLIILFFLSFNSPIRGSASKNPLLFIDSPGDGSRLTSPIELSVEIGGQDPALIRMTLTDRSGTIIARKLLPVDTNEGSQFDLYSDLAFEIPNDTSDGLLSIALLDSSNRPITLRSASLILLTKGGDQIVAPDQKTEWLTVTQPQPGEAFSGGSFRVTGTVTPLLQRPVFFEIVTDSGGQIGTRQLPVESAGEPLDFEIDIPHGYINQERDVRLIIRQSDPKFGETIILDSVPIFLSP